MAVLIKKDTATHYHFFMADPTDMTQGKEGLSSFTFQTYKPGGSSFATQSFVITEIDGGWYTTQLSGGAISTSGVLAINVSASGAVPWRDQVLIVDALPGELTDTMIDKIVASIFREPMTTIEGSSYGDTITTTNLSLYKAVMAIVGKVALINSGTTKRIYKTDESSTALDLTLTSGAAPANPIIAQEP